MQHTIVIEVPDGADPNEVERWATQQIEAQPYSTDGHGGRDYLRVVEYHQEQMTEPTDEESHDDIFVTLTSMKGGERKCIKGYEVTRSLGGDDPDPEPGASWMVDTGNPYSDKFRLFAETVQYLLELEPKPAPPEGEA
jgi:hypothetical protein